MSLREGRMKSKIGGSSSVFLQVRNSGSRMDAVILNPLCIQMLLGTTRSQEWGSANRVWLLVSAESPEGLEERPSPGDLGTALYNEGLPLSTPHRSLMKEILLACPNCFIVMVSMNAYILLRVNQGLTFCRKGCPGWKESSLAEHSGPI